MLAYAFDRRVPAKHAAARRLVDRIDSEGTGAASIQVLQELYVTLTRKIAPSAAPEIARTIVADLLTWKIVEPTGADVIEAIDNALRWQVSFWDAMLITAAQRVHAEVLWSEDLNHGQVYGSVRVQNPFVVSTG